ncbi:hypothetical protein LIER_24939 [Lithospermum erythrorhizon]|uniref:Uncharacterized protein n=1 Tax=Lithospermum erythrorhizon TaxID=34254 RepID=A0AAV3R557_LITER
MGSICVRPSISKNGILQSVSAAMWRSTSPGTDGSLLIMKASKLFKQVLRRDLDFESDPSLVFQKVLKIWSGEWLFKTPERV